MERELWKILYRLTWEWSKPKGKWLYATADVVVCFWAVLHDRPTRWAATPENWPDDLRPMLLPPQSTLSRRLRRPEAVELMTAVEEHLWALIVVESCLVRIIDGKALAVSNASKDPDTGYGRGAGGNQKGYKLHAKKTKHSGRGGLGHRRQSVGRLRFMELLEAVRELDVCHCLRKSRRATYLRLGTACRKALLERKAASSGTR
jgi:hypothetical protein